jgi:hypothetical protein
MRRLLEIDPCLDLREKPYLQAQRRGDCTEQSRVFGEGAERYPESANNRINYAGGVNISDPAREAPQ